MKNIILDWLNNDLKLDVDQNYTKDSFKNGILIARILYSYNIINDEILNEMIKNAEIPEDSSNLGRLSYWMKLLGISFNLEATNDLIAGKGTSIIKIMYQLYLSLNSRMYSNKLGDIKKRQKEYREWCGKNMKIGKSSSPASGLKHKDVNNNKPNTIQNVIETKNYQNETKFDDIDCKGGDFQFSYFHKSCTSTELDKSREIDKFNHSNTKSKYEYLIKKKLIKEEGRQDLKSRLYKNIMNQVWTNIDDKCKNLYINEYLDQTPNPNYRISEDPNIQSINQQELTDKLIVWGKRGSEPNHVSDEVERTWSYNYNRKLELHKKLWNKRIKLQNRCRYNLCKELIEYCIDSAFQRCEKSLTNKCLPLSNDYGDDGEKVFTKTHSAQSILQSSFGIPILNVMTRKYQRHKGCSYDEYFYLTGDWFDQKLLAYYKKIGDDGDNSNIVLGCIIHSLFDSNDTRLRSSKLMKYPISCVVSNSKNASLLRKGLQAALGKSSILVVDRETAIDYCKKVYVENNPRPPSSKGDKSKKEKKTGAKKLSKKSSRNQSTHTFKDQEVQVDGVPDTDEINNLNECIKNGHKVSECLRTKNAVGNDLVAKCIASVLKNHQNKMKGWVIVNFPTSYEEACLFENYLAGNLGIDTCLRSNNYSENARNAFQSESLQNTSVILSDTHLYYSSLIKNPSVQGKNVQHDSFITKYISMLCKDKRQGEERGSLRIDRRESKTVNLETYFRKSEILQEFSYDKLDKQIIIDLAHCIITDAVADGNIDYEIDENALNLSFDTAGRPPSSKKSRKNPQKPEVNPFLPDQNKMTTWDFRRKFKPGDENWSFVNCSLSSHMRQYLIQLWQLTESSYLESLDKLFSSFYEIEEKVNLYWNFVEQKVTKILFNNEERNFELKRFTEKHDIEKATSCDALTSELLFKLWNLSDLKRKNAVDNIVNLLEGSTVVVDLMKNLWNIFVILMQVEMKRWIDALTILQYYYLTVLNVKNFESISFFDKAIENLHSQKFDEPDWKDNNSVEMFIEKNSDLFIHTAQELTKLINKSRKTLEIDLVKSYNILLSASEITALLIEWEAAIDYEIQRLTFRINLIKRKALFDIININDRAKELNQGLSSMVEEIFLLDNKCSANSSSQIDEAHSENICVLRSLEFIGNEYYVSRKSNNCKELICEAGTVITSSKYFTLPLLEKMSVHLNALAPGRRIDRISLSFLLDDWNHKKTNRMLPDDWCDLTRQQICDILETISNKNGTVDWKEFLLFGTLQSYPSKVQLLTQYRNFRKLDSEQLGTLSFEDFTNNNTLWFGSSQIDRLQNLLFWIFKTEEGRFDYRSFLMKLCKDEDPVLGFGKALSLRCNEFVVVTDEDLNCKRKVEEYHKCSLKIVKQILDQVVLDVINLSESAVVYEYRDWEQDSVPLWWKLGRLPIVCPFKSFAPPHPDVEKEDLLMNKLRKLDWTYQVPSEILVRLLEEGRDSIRKQCTENFDKLFNENCSRLKSREFQNAKHVLSKDIFVMDQILKDPRFKAISLTKLINREKNISK